MKYNKYAVKSLSTAKKISEIIKFKVFVYSLLCNGIDLRNYQALEAKLVTVCCGKCFSLHNLYANLYAILTSVEYRAYFDKKNLIFFRSNLSFISTYLLNLSLHYFRWSLCKISLLHLLCTFSNTQNLTISMSLIFFCRYLFMQILAHETFVEN